MSNQTFKIGEIAIINQPLSIHHGKECEILSGLTLAILQTSWDGAESKDFCYAVSISGHGRISSSGFPLGYKPSELRKRPDDKPFTNWFNEHIITDIRPTERQVREGLKGILHPFGEKAGEG